MSQIIVAKFGGTSLADTSRIQHVANIIAHICELGRQVVVIVSARAGETEELLQSAYHLNTHADPRELDVLLSTGEQKSAALLALALQSKNIQARSLNAWQVPIMATGQFQHARICDVKTKHIKALLANNIVPIITGFQGIEKDDIKTIGRGGSDLTAVAVAAALHAHECQIYTDTAGIFTADPRIVPNAKRIEYLTYEEALAMAKSGAKVLQQRSLEFAGKYQVPLRVLSSFEDHGGTLISYEHKEKSEWRPVGIASQYHVVKLNERASVFTDNPQLQQAVEQLKLPFAEHILLSPDNYDYLAKEYGQRVAEGLIQRRDLTCLSIIGYLPEYCEKIDSYINKLSIEPNVICCGPQVSANKLSLVVEPAPAYKLINDLHDMCLIS